MQTLIHTTGRIGGHSGGGHTADTSTKGPGAGLVAVLRSDAMETAGTLTRADLAEALHSEIGLSRAESSKIVEQILHEMCAALSRGENVKISGFGTFVLRDKGERVGRNPKTGVEVPIAPRRVLTFRASQMMRERIVAAG